MWSTSPYSCWQTPVLTQPEQKQLAKFAKNKNGCKGSVEKFALVRESRCCEWAPSSAVGDICSSMFYLCKTIPAVVWLSTWRFQLVLVFDNSVRRIWFASVFDSFLVCGYPQVLSRLGKTFVFSPPRTHRTDIFTEIGPQRAAVFWSTAQLT